MSATRRFPRASLALVTLLGAGCSGTEPPTVAVMLDRIALEPLAQQCRDAGGTLRTQDAMHTLDLDGDDRDEHLLFSGWLACDAAARIDRDRESYVAVYSDKGEAVFEDRVLDIKIERTGTRAELWLALKGPACGFPEAPTSAEERFCERRVVDLAEGRFGYASLDTIRVIE